MAGEGASGINYEDICPICGKERGEYCTDVEELIICPNKEKCGNNKPYHKGGFKRKGCSGYLTGNTATGGTQIGSNIMVHKYGSPKPNVHPLHFENNCIQAHHLICAESMNNPKWKAFCKMTGYNINCWRNGVYLPNDPKLSCLIGIQCHKGPHEKGRGLPGITTYQPYKTYVDSVKSLINEISEYNKKGCEKSTAEDVIQDLNDISEIIMNHIKNFEWTIAWDSFNYDRGFKPFVGCAGASTLPDKKKKIKKVLNELVDITGKKAKSMFVTSILNEDMDVIQSKIEELSKEREKGKTPLFCHLDEHNEEFDELFVVTAKMYKLNYGVGH